MTTTITAPALTGNQIAGIKRSKAFGPLKGAFEVLVNNGGFSETDALVRLGLVEALPAAPADPDAERVAALVATGKFTEAQARSIVAAAAQPQHFTPTVPAQAAPAKAEPVTSKAQADVLVTQQGLAHAKGRVYLTGAMLEAGARVLKNGTPEIIASSGAGRTTHVLIFRTDGGDLAAQNLYKPV